VGDGACPGPEDSCEPRRTVWPSRGLACGLRVGDPLPVPSSFSSPWPPDAYQRPDGPGCTQVPVSSPVNAEARGRHARRDQDGSTGRCVGASAGPGYPLSLRSAPRRRRWGSLTPSPGRVKKMQITQTRHCLSFGRPPLGHALHPFDVVGETCHVAQHLAIFSLAQVWVS